MMKFLLILQERKRPLLLILRRNCSIAKKMFKAIWIILNCLYLSFRYLFDYIMVSVKLSDFWVVFLLKWHCLYFIFTAFEAIPSIDFIFAKLSLMIHNVDSLMLLAWETHVFPYFLQKTWFWDFLQYLNLFFYRLYLQVFERGCLAIFGMLKEYFLMWRSS